MGGASLRTGPATTEGVVVVERQELPVQREEDVVLARRLAKDIARRRGFDAFAQAAITTATSEIARNALVHGGGGAAVVEVVERAGRVGVRVSCKDSGPGIVELTRALAGGFSATGTLGLGLSGSRRLVDDFHIDTGPGRGTLVVLVKWIRA